MFAKLGSVIRNVSNIVRRFFALWISLNRRPSRNILSREALLPMEELMFMRFIVIEAKEMIIRVKSKMFQESLK